CGITREGPPGGAGSLCQTPCRMTDPKWLERRLNEPRGSAPADGAACRHFGARGDGQEEKGGRMERIEAEAASTAKKAPTRGRPPRRLPMGSRFKIGSSASTGIRK